MYKKSRQYVAYLLVFIIVVSLFSGCAKEDVTQDSSLIPTQMISPNVSLSPTSSLKTSDGDNENEDGKYVLSPSIIPSVDIAKTLSLELEDYIGDVETFVYGLLTNEIKLRFDVFPACVMIEGGTAVFGIGYTDYEDLYESEENGKCYYSAGFISSCGDLLIPENEIDDGLEIINMDFDSDEIGYVLTYESAPLKRHCIVYGKYVEYGIDDNRQIYYFDTPFQDVDRNSIDFDELGSLYSYETGNPRLMYEAGDGGFVLPEGISLPDIDYTAVEKEIREAIANQDANEIEYKVNSYVTIAQGAVQNYLLSLQQETFMGYNVDYLIEEIKKVEPSECIRITPEGLEIVDAYKSGPSLARFLVGTASVISVAIGLVGTFICAEVPVLSATAGAVIAFAINSFVQIVVEKKSLSEVDWKSIVIGTIAGAISGFVGPYISAVSGGAVGFLLDSALDGIIGGVEQLVEKHINGDEGKSDLETFGYGFCVGFAFSSVLKGVAKGAGALLTATGKGVYTVIPKSLQNKIKKLGKTLKNKIKKSNFVKKLTKIKDKLNKSSLHSEYIAKKTEKRLLELYKQKKKYLQDSIDELSTKDLYDQNGKTFSKNRIPEIYDDFEEGDTIGYYIVNGEKINVVKKNGVVDVVFDESKYTSVELDEIYKYVKNGKTTRKEIHLKAIEKFKELWKKNPDSIPKSLVEKFDEMGVDWEKLSNDDILDIIHKSDMVLHEKIDMKTIVLVSRAVHDKALGGVAHWGGVAYAKKIKADLAIRDFDRIISIISTVGATNAS